MVSLLKICQSVLYLFSQISKYYYLIFLNFCEVVMGSVIGILTNGTILSQIIIYQRPQPKKEKKTNWGLAWIGRIQKARSIIILLLSWKNINIIFHHFQVSKRDYLTGSTRKILVVELLFHPVFISSFFCRVMKIGNSLLQWIIHVFSLLNIILVEILSFMQQGREAGILKSDH